MWADENNSSNCFLWTSFIWLTCSWWRVKPPTWRLRHEKACDSAPWWCQEIVFPTHVHNIFHGLVNFEAVKPCVAVNDFTRPISPLLISLCRIVILLFKVSCNRVFENGLSLTSFYRQHKCKLLALFVSANILTKAEFSIDFCVCISK